MATKTKTRPIDVETLAQEAQEAAEAADRLDAEMRAGDLSISPSDVREAQTDAEDKALRLESARAAQAKVDAEARRKKGEQLWQDWQEQSVSAVRDVEKTLTEATRAVGKALDALDALDETKNAYRRQWGELYRDAQDEPDALRWKSGSSTGGSFGVVPGTPIALPRIDALQLALVHVVSSITGRANAGADADWYRQLDVNTPTGNELRQLRQIVKKLNEREKEK